MFLKNIILISICCYSVILKAQIYDLDSLLTVVNKPLVNDYDSIKANTDFAKKLSANYPDIALRLAEKSIELAKDNDDQTNIMKALTVLGVLDWRKGNLDEGLIRFFEIKTLAENANDSARLGTVYVNLANIYDDLFAFRDDLEARDIAIKYGLKAFVLYDRLDNKNQLGTITNNLGTMYSQRNKFDSAFFFLNRALEIKKILNDTIKISSTLNNIGLVYWRQKKLEPAIRYYNQSIALSNAVNDHRGLALAFMNKGNALTALKNYDAAYHTYQNALEHAEIINSNKWISGIYGQIFGLEYRRGNLESAFEYQEMYYKAREEIIENSQELKIKNIETNHSLKSKEIELVKMTNEVELIKEREKNQNLIRNFLIAGILLIVVFGFILFRNQRQKLEHEKQYQMAKRGLTQLELENSKLKEKELEKELVHKNQELTSYTMNFIQKNQMLEDLKGMTNEIINSSHTDDLSKQLQRVNRVINQNQNQEKDWEDFRLFFESVHTGFFTQLKSNFPSLTPSDLKLSALVRLNMNLKETANVFGVEPSSIKTARYRLKKKLNLKQDDDLQGFLMAINS